MKFSIGCAILFALCVAGASADLTSSVVVDRFIAGVGGYNQSQYGTDYAEVGDYTDPENPVPWTHSNGTGSITGCGRAAADYGSLKAELYMSYTDSVAGGDREQFRVSSSASFTQMVQVSSSTGLWTGTSPPDNYDLVFKFRLTGSLVSSGHVKPTINVLGQYPGNPDGMEPEPGETYWDSIAYFGFPAPDGDYDEEIEMHLFGYQGEAFESGLSLGLSCDNTNYWDLATSGECTMDFFSTVQLQSVTLYDNNTDEDVVVFDAAGNVTGGTSTEGFSFDLVPEPATISMLALGGLALIRRRK